MEVDRGDVDGDAREGKPQALPFLELAADLLERPQADRHDIAALLRDRDELVRPEQPALRVIPPYERPDGAHAPLVQTELRLVDEPALPVGAGLLQNRLDEVAAQD